MAWLAHLGLEIPKRVRRALMREDQSHDVNKSAVGETENDGIGHEPSPLAGYWRQNGLAASSSACSRVRPMSARSRFSWASSRSALLWPLRTIQAATALRHALNANLRVSEKASPGNRPARADSWSS